MSSVRYSGYGYPISPPTPSQIDDAGGGGGGGGGGDAKIGEDSACCILLYFPQSALLPPTTSDLPLTERRSVEFPSFGKLPLSLSLSLSFGKPLSVSAAALPLGACDRGRRGDFPSRAEGGRKGMDVGHLFWPHLLEREVWGGRMLLLRAWGEVGGAFQTLKTKVYLRVRLTGCPNKKADSIIQSTLFKYLPMFSCIAGLNDQDWSLIKKI